MTVYELFWFTAGIIMLFVVLAVVFLVMSGKEIDRLEQRVNEMEQRQRAGR